MIANGICVVNWKVKLFLKMSDPKKTIFLAHEPPKDTKLDLINNPASPMDGKHLGDEYFSNTETFE